MKISAVLLPGLLAVTFNAPAADCENAGDSLAAVHACLYEQLDKDLDAAYRPLQRGLAAKNPEAATLLQKSQASWAKFAEDSCAFTTRLNATNMIEGDVRYNCQADFTHARIKVLKAWAAQYK